MDKVKKIFIKLVKPLLNKTGILKTATSYLRKRKRRKFALSYYLPKIKQIKKWITDSREETNFTYDLTDENINYLAHTISVITKENFYKVLGYINEIRNNSKINNQLLNMIEASDFKETTDKTMNFGRRLGWYAFARIMKPKIIVETGVDKGLGAVCLCEALRKNKQEGFQGYYYGTDINPSAGYLFYDKLKNFGEILYGDSISSLRKFTNKIDLFINDSDHSPKYEYKEYCTITKKLNNNAIILGDNSHCSPSLEIYSRKYDRKFLFFKEVPANHWYPGAGIGMSFK